MQITEHLVQAALGRIQADLMICNAYLVNVYTAEIETVDISVLDGYIVRVEKTEKRGSYTAKTVVDATGKYLIPGLIDAHSHVEMSFMTATSFAEAVLPHGTTAGIFDTHDIGNVSEECLLWFGKEFAATPLKGYITVPPCIPSSPGLEDAGIVMNLDKLKYCHNVDNFIAIGETMDFNRIISGESEMMKMLSWAKQMNLCIDGHCPELRGDALQAYVAAGPSTDHEFTSIEEALEKYRLGMKIVVRRGSLAEPYNAGELVSRIKDTSHLLLATDGCITLDTIVRKGTMIQALRMIVEEGVDPIFAVQMGTINVAKAYGLDRKIGAIAPGLCADMILVNDLKDFVIDSVYVDGKKLPEAGNLKLQHFQFPENVMNTISLRQVKEDDFKIKAPMENGNVQVHVLEVWEDKLISGNYVTNVEVKNGRIMPDIQRDLLKISVWHRYEKNGSHTTALVRGFGLKKGAIAGSIAQDSQNIVVIGTKDNDMAIAVNAVTKMQGGVVFVADGKIQSAIELRFGGIMNEKLHPEEILQKFEEFNEITRKFGCKFENPAFPLSLMLTCACIPDLKITNRSLVDALKGEGISIFGE